MIPESKFYGGARVLTGSTITRGMLKRTRTLVAPLGAGFSFITLPDARDLELGGPQVTVINLTASNFLVKNNAGTTVATIATTKTATLFLSAKADAAGHWRVISFASRGARQSAVTVPFAAPPALPTESALYWEDDLAAQANNRYTFNVTVFGSGGSSSFPTPSHYSSIVDASVYALYDYDVSGHYMVAARSGFRKIMWKNPNSDAIQIKVKFTVGTSQSGGFHSAGIDFTIGDDGEFDDPEGKYRYISIGKNFSPAGNGVLVEWHDGIHSDVDNQQNYSTPFVDDEELDITIDVTATTITVACVGHETVTITKPSTFAAYTNLVGRDGLIHCTMPGNSRVGVKVRSFSIYRQVPVAYPLAPAEVHCLGAKYRLTDCSDSAIHLYTDSDLAVAVNQVVKVNEHAGCWAVELWGAAVEADGEVEVITIKKNAHGKKLVYADCTACGAPEKIRIQFTDALLIGPKYTSQPEMVLGTDYCDITGPLFYKPLAEDLESVAATLFQLFAGEEGTAAFSFTMYSDGHLRRYFPVKNGVKVHWKSGDVDTEDSTSQQLDVAYGDMVQIGFSLATTGDEDDLVPAYLNDAARTASILHYDVENDNANATNLIRTAGPEATFITYSGYYNIYADMGVPWKITPPTGATVVPSHGQGRRQVYIDVGGISEGHTPKQGTLTWTASSFGDIRKRHRPMYFTRLDATIPDDGATEGLPEFLPWGLEFVGLMSPTGLYFVFNGGFQNFDEPQTLALLNRPWVDTPYPGNNPTGVTVTSGPEWWAWATPGHESESVGGGISGVFVGGIGTIDDYACEGPGWLNLRKYIDEFGSWWVEFTLNQHTTVSLDGIIRVYFKTPDLRTSFIETRIYIGVNSESEPW